MTMSGLETLFGGRLTSRPPRVVHGLTEYGLTELESAPNPMDGPCHCPCCQPNQIPMRGRINQRRLREHCARMGIKLPVRIQLDKGLAGTRDQGNHHINCDAISEQEQCNVIQDGMFHVVRLNPLLSAKNGNWTTHHELRHAEQREKGGVPMMDLYNRLDKTYGYFENPFEIDAELAAMQFAHLPPIVVE